MTVWAILKQIILTLPSFILNGLILEYCKAFEEKSRIGVYDSSVAFN